MSMKNPLTLKKSFEEPPMERMVGGPKTRRRSRFLTRFLPGWAQRAVANLEPEVAEDEDSKDEAWR